MNLQDKLGKIVLAHALYWYGQPGDTSTMHRYVSTDPNVIADQISAMQNLGIGGILALTFGPTVNPFIHQTVMEACRQCGERGMLFGLVLDPWVAKASTDKTAAVIASLQHPDMQTMLSSRGYLPERYVLDFGTGADSVRVMNAVPGMSMLNLGTGFSWPSFSSSSALATLARQNALPTMKIPGVCPRFNDGYPGDRNKSVWGGNVRVLESQAGNFFWDQVALAPKTSKYVQLITWNDYFEDTAIEPSASMLWGRIGK